MQTLGAILSNQTSLGAIFAQIFRDFAKVFTEFIQIYTNFVRIFKDFSRICNISKRSGVLLHPLHSRPLHHWCSNTVTADSG